MSLIRPEVTAVALQGELHLGSGVKADLNESPWDWPEKLKEKASRILRSIPMNRYPVEGAELATALADRFELDSSSILVGNGSNELLLALFLASAGGGRSVLVPRPSFGVYRQMVAVSGARATELLLEEGVSYRPEDWLEALVREKPHLVLICSPNNPSGACFPEDALEEVLAQAPGLVAVDEAYSEFSGHNLRRLLKRHANLVLLRTFSKAWGAAGLRLGYLMAAPDVAAGIRKALLPFRLNRISARLGMLALQHASLFEDRVRRIVAERARLLKGLKALPGVTAYPSRANFILIRLANRPASGVCEELRVRGILVRRFTSVPELEDCLRITVASPNENKAILRALREVLL